VTARLDFYTGNGLRLADAVAVASITEAARLGGLWTLEAHTEPFLPLALAAEHTSRIRLGTSVAVALARNPMVVAHLAHELNRFAAGRFELGLGPQVGAHIVRRYGEKFDHPAERMAEFVDALRAIWSTWNDGSPLRFEGRFYRHTLMTPAFDPGPSGFGSPRVHLAAVGPRMVDVACRLADGLIAHPLSSPRVITERLRPAVADATRPDFQLSCPVLVITGRTDDEIASARQQVRKQLAFYASTPSYRSVLELHGAGDVADRLRELSRTGQWDAMTELISDELLAEFSVEAPIASLVARLHERFDDLLDVVLIYAPYEVDHELWLDLNV
jgi:probable F420-dependent oxidoreductase